MAKVKRDDSNNPWAVDPGVYEAIIIAIEEKKGQQGREFLSWKFKIQEPIQNGEPCENDVTINGGSPMVFREGDKLDKWLNACGITLEDNDEFDLDAVIGSRVQVVVEKNKKGYDQVTNVLPIRKKSQQKTQQKQEEEAEEGKPTKAQEKPKQAAKPAPKQEEPAEDEAPPPPKNKPKPKPAEEASDEDVFDFDA
ncbi:MAG: DUF669 domain-containing protein [Candidatus Paceibacterota bacterium]